MNYTSEQLENAFNKIPENLQDAVYSVSNYEILKKIRETNTLNEKQAEELGSETGLVLLGLTHPKDFVTNLKTRLGVTDEVAKKIRGMIDEQIFRGVKESLEKIHGITASSLQSKPAQKILEETLNAAPKLIPKNEPPPAKSAEKILEETFPRPIKTAPPPANLPTGDFSFFQKTEKSTASSSPTVEKQIEPSPSKIGAPIPLKEKPVVWETPLTSPKQTMVNSKELPLQPILPVSKKGAWDFPEENPEGLSKDDILSSIENPREKSKEIPVKTGTVVPPIKETESIPTVTKKEIPLPPPPPPKPQATMSKPTPPTPEAKIIPKPSTPATIPERGKRIDPYREAI